MKLTDILDSVEVDVEDLAEQRRETARAPGDIEFGGTETRSWSDVDTTLGAFISAFGTEEEQEEATEAGDLSQETRSAIAARTILGNGQAAETAGLISVPVVNPATDNLNEGALDAAASAAGGGRGADLPDSEGIQSTVDTLRARHFEEQEESVDHRSVDEQEERSFEDIRRLLRSALHEEENLGEDEWVRIEAVFDDRVVYCIGGGPLFQRSYSADESGEVALGDPVRVTQRTKFEPVEESMSRNGDGGDAETRDLFETFPEGQILEQARVDRRQSRIQDVALLGKVSRNNRVYSDQALREAAELYEGARFFLDHPTDTEMEERDGVRSVQDLAGRVVNARKVGEQVRGDLEILEREPTQSLVFALAEQMPQLVGNSHRARGSVRVDETGRQVVESLDHVFAVELVTEPATVGGLRESLDLSKEEEDTMDPSELTVEQLRQERPDLVEALVERETIREQLEDLRDEVEELRPLAEQAEELEEQLEEVTEERDDLQDRIEELEEREVLRQREDSIREALQEAGIEPSDVPEILQKPLLEAETEEELEEVVEQVTDVLDSGGSDSGEGGSRPRLFERDFDRELEEAGGANGRKPVTGEAVAEASERMFG